ncbi:unnamed protein product [Triticum turgidum subsp. durum]|uniref:Uncharacterized protein n=1 Tax=Triticum turgidum subsp. durum TaxID=4567 RepID=A0A9R1BZV0_TRITD|nr:unnamed protein product [Triticum turgidum subsp. durum]
MDGHRCFAPTAGSLNLTEYAAVHQSDQLTLGALESAVHGKFRSLKHVPVWKDERPSSIRGGDELKVYKIYPIGLTERQALYKFQFNDDAEVARYIKGHPCAKLEVIFV